MALSKKFEDMQNQILSLLKHKFWVNLIGLSGSGKTTLIHDLIRKVDNRKEAMCFIYFKLSDFNQTNGFVYNTIARRIVNQLEDFCFKHKQNYETNLDQDYRSGNYMFYLDLSEELELLQTEQFKLVFVIDDINDIDYLKVCSKKLRRLFSILNCFSHSVLLISNFEISQIFEINLGSITITSLLFTRPQPEEFLEELCNSLKKEDVKSRKNFAQNFNICLEGLKFYIFDMREFIYFFEYQFPEFLNSGNYNIRANLAGYICNSYLHYKVCNNFTSIYRDIINSSNLYLLENLSTMQKIYIVAAYLAANIPQEEDEYFFQNDFQIGMSSKHDSLISNSTTVSKRKYKSKKIPKVKGMFRKPKIPYQYMLKEDIMVNIHRVHAYFHALRGIVFRDESKLDFSLKRFKKFNLMDFHNQFLSDEDILSKLGLITYYKNSMGCGQYERKILVKMRLEFVTKVAESIDVSLRDFLSEDFYN